jgi:hypothetical protein
MFHAPDQMPEEAAMEEELPMPVTSQPMFTPPTNSSSQLWPAKKEGQAKPLLAEVPGAATAWSR